MFNRDKKESGYAFFDVDASMADIFISKPHQVKNALINCKIAADSTQISEAQRDEMSRKLYVSNLPYNTSDLDLLKIFEPYAQLSKAYLVRNRFDGSCKNFGFVLFQYSEDLEEFLKFPPLLIFRGRKLNMKKAVDRLTQKNNKYNESLENKKFKGTYFSDGIRVNYFIGSNLAQAIRNSIFLNEKSENYRFNRGNSLPGPQEPMPGNRGFLAL